MNLLSLYFTTKELDLLVTAVHINQKWHQTFWPRSCMVNQNFDIAWNLDSELKEIVTEQYRRNQRIYKQHEKPSLGRRLSLQL